MPDQLTTPAAAALAITLPKLSADLITESFSGQIVGALADRDYTLVQSVDHKGQIDKLTVQLGAGTATIQAKINGTLVTGLSVAAATSEANDTPTSGNTYVIGDKIEINISASAAAADLGFSLDAQRRV